MWWSTCYASAIIQGGPINPAALQQHCRYLYFEKCVALYSTYFSCSRSGFFLFCSEQRPKIKVTNPGLTIGDVAKKLGEMWNNLTEATKKPYVIKAGKLKEKYEKVCCVCFK